MGKQKTVQIAVSNDILHDQRILKTATTLTKIGYNVSVTGRIQSGRAKYTNIKQANIRFKCFRMLFHSNVFFYAEWNFRLCIWLLFKKADLFWSNDLDTLPAVYIAAKLRRRPIIFDSHEYFTEVPELTHNKFAKKVWKHFERKIVPHLAFCFTVNTSIANLFKQKYDTHFEVLRNVPLASKFKNHAATINVNLPKDKFIVIMQGSGINMHRGAEELLMSAQYLSEDCLILFIGGGGVFPRLKTMAKQEKYKNKVLILGKMPYSQLIEYTKAANLGASLDKDTNTNYKFSLPNKLFDYIHAGLPIIASNLVEVKNIITEYNVGSVVYKVSPKVIAQAILEYKKNTSIYTMHKKNTEKAARELCWEEEQDKIEQMISRINS